MRERSIALNFLALASQEFEFEVFRADPASLMEDEKRGRQRRLPKTLGDKDFENYRISLELVPGWQPFRCVASTNKYLTLDYLFLRLKQRCQETLGTSEFRVDARPFRNRILFTLASYAEGDQAVWLEPYFLEVEKLYGFLLDFKFNKADGVKFSRRIQQLSLSLDSQLRSNTSFYLDRFDKIRAFVSNYHPRIFPLGKIAVKSTLHELPSSQLKPKAYVFGDNKTRTSQFGGMKEFGPLRPVIDSARLLFVYTAEDKPLSHDLYRALRGDTFRAVFPGILSMFRLRLDRDHVAGFEVPNFGDDALRSVLENVRREPKPTLPVIIAPWGREDEFVCDYYRAKQMFLAAGIPIQVVLTDTLRRKETLKWSIANISLQVFAKLGGKPWMVKPETHRCLVIGIGQAHQIDVATDTIKRYFAYTVLSDSSGIYKELRVIGNTVSSSEYYGGIRAGISRVLVDYAADFDTFVVHTTFDIKKAELDAISEALQTQAAALCKKIVGIKLSDKNKYFGYSPAVNSLVPYENTFVQLSRTEFLVWFEGLAQNKAQTYRRTGGPVHAQFFYPGDFVPREEMLRLLQDAANLAGANWRGFNAKSLPVSTFYASIVAKFLRQFDACGLPRTEAENMNPWFL